METYAQTFSSGLEMSPRSGMTWGSSLSLECSLDAVYEALLAKQHVVGSLLVNFAGPTVVVRPVFTSSVEGHEDGVRRLCPSCFDEVNEWCQVNLLSATEW